MARHSTPGPLDLCSRLAGTEAFRLAAAWAVVASIAAGCSEAPKGRPCSRDQDCSAGSVCREGLCITLAVGIPTIVRQGPELTNAAVVHVSGLASAAVKVHVYDGAVELDEATVTADAWALDLTLAEGTHSFTARAEGAAGQLSPASPAVSVTVDRTRPQVVSRSPVPGSASHDFRQKILVSFDEPVFLGAQQGKLTPSGGSDIVVVPESIDAQTISLTPTNRVTPATFTVTVPADLHDAAGNLVQLPAGAWTFTAPAWLPVGDGSPLNVDAAKDAQAVFTFTRSEVATGGIPQPGISDGRRRGGIARGAGSELWVASVDTDAAGVGTAPLVVRHWDGAAWSTLPSNPSTNVGEAVLAALGTTPVVAYVEGTSLSVKRWTGTAWTTFETPAAPLNTSGTPAAIAHALDPAGNPAVAWIDTSTFNLMVRRWLGAAWSTAEIVTGAVSNPTPVIDPQNPPGQVPGATSLASDGTELAVAVVKPGGNADLVHVYRRNAAGPSWDLVGGAPLVAFGNDTFPGTQPTLVLKQGKPAVGWIVNNGCTTCRAVAVVAEFTTTWPAQLLDLNRTADQYAAAPQLALATGGQLVATWHEGPSTPYRSYASLLDAGTWGPLGGPDEGLLLVSSRAVAPFLVLDAANVPIVLHQEVSGTTAQIYVRRYNAVALP